MVVIANTMDINEIDKTQEQHKKQYDWLRGYQFVKGQSGNPGGRPKGSKSLKTFAREFLETLPEDEKIEYLKTLPSEIVWKMAEGMPETKGDLNVKAELKIEISEDIAKKYDDTPLNSKDNSTGQD